MSTVTREEFDNLKKAFEEYVNSAQSSSSAPSAPSSSSEPKKKKELSSYNKYMSETIKKLKETNPDMDMKTVFKLAVENWKKK